jgi:dephospho-CoA kinase
MTQRPYRILRQGALPAEKIAAALAEHLTLIGITGPSGSGKTSALREIERQGGLVLDCDAVYHELLAGSTALLEELEEAFPGTVRGGTLDRRELGKRVFSDPEALARLNAISHRYVSAEVEQRLRDWAMAGGTLAAIDAIELISSGLGARCRATVAVLAEREMRVGRIMARDGISREDAERRVNAQRDDRYFIDNCDYALYNNGDRATFTEEFQTLLKEIEHE